MQFENRILLELGDIIEINAPNNSDIHNQNFYINYIDSNKIKGISLSNNSNYLFNLNENGNFTDESIESVTLLSRSAEKGFIKQNNIQKNNWINIYFSGDYPQIINGEVTNIEEDMLEITTYPELEVIYIDFEYKGIPENIPIDSITISNKPESLNHIQSLSLVKNEFDQGNLDEIPSETPASIELLDNGESYIDAPEDTSYDSLVIDDLNKSYAESNKVIFGKKLDAVKTYIEVPEEEQRFDINTQVNDLMDELISSTPNKNKTMEMKEKINILINRFKELRENYSKFDSNNTIYDISLKTAFHKPIVKSFEEFNNNIDWVVPIVSNTKSICIDNSNIYSNDTLYSPGNGLEDLFEFIEKYYKQKQSNLDYKTMMTVIHNTFTSFNKPNDDNINNILVKVIVNDSFEGIVENMQSFTSTTVHKNNVQLTPYAFQRYIKGEQYLEEKIKNNISRFELTNITPNDTLHLKSFILLPKPIMDYTKLRLKKSNILDKSILNLNHFAKFRLFKKKLDLNMNSISDLNKEITYKDHKSITSNDIDMLKKINYFQIQNDNINIDSIEYAKFLECIFPKTINILKILRNHLSDHFTLEDIVKETESFLVYNDDLTYNQYKEIRFIINENLRNLKEKYAKNSVLFNKILTKSDRESKEYNNSISKILMDDKELYDQLLETYKIDITTSESETLNNIFKQDNSVLFNAMISSHLNVLNTPKSLIDILEKTDIEDMDENKMAYSDDCFKRYLSKKYTSIEKLQDDNNKEIYFDKDYDDSPYYLLEKYENEMKNMNSEDFLEYLKINLEDRHGIDKENSELLSNILFNKQKPVEDDHYALLELSPHLIDKSKVLDDYSKDMMEIEKNAKMQKIYYKRVKNVWIKDDSIEDIAFLDTNDLFCNISDKCFKNSKNSVCESEDYTKIRNLKQLKSDLLGEFDKRYEINADELEKQNLKRINYFSNMLSIKNILKDIQNKKQNNVHFLLGTFANNDPIIKSPHLEKLNEIMSDNDFVRKQYNILKFVELYTRQPIIKEVDESTCWLYCKETNTKLLPKFVFELAEAFSENNNYLDKLNLIISNHGEEEGEYIVDRNSGWKISKIMDIEEERYDETGRRIINNDILVENIAISSESNVKLPKMFENKESEKIYNIFSHLCDNLNIIESKIEENVLITSAELSSGFIMSKEKYDKKAKELKEKKGKDTVPYNIYYDETLVIIVSSCVLISIQTAIPSLIVKKTFPGCLKNFSGYPLTGVENTNGIKYVSCVISKIKSSIPPWNSISKYSESTIFNRLKQTIEKIVSKRLDINEMILKKKEYLILNPEKEIDDTVGLKRWIEFLPPLVDINLPKNINNVSNDFKREIYNNMLKSRPKQFEMYYALVSKNHKITLSMINNINKIIKNMPLLLNTTTSVPFLDNACCNEIIEKDSAFNFFVNKEPSIGVSLKAVESNITLLKDIVNLSKAPLLISKTNKISQNIEINSDFSEMNIYLFFIHACKYDTMFNVPEKFRSICGERPSDYNKDATIEEKIVFLKKNDRKFSKDGCRTLLNLINKENKIYPNIALEFSFLDPLKDILQSLDSTNSTIIEQPLRKHLLNVLNNYKKDKYYEVTSISNDNTQLYALKKYLVRTNNNLLIQIMDFLSRYGDLNDSLYEKYKNYLFNLTEWNIDTNNDSYFDNGIHNISQFTKNCVFDYSKYYPSLIINGKINNTVHKHWQLSDKHNKAITKIIEDYYKEIVKFMNDESLHELIKLASQNLTDINLFLNNLPLQTEFKKDGKTFYNLLDKETIMYLIKYCHYSCYYEFISLTDNDEIFDSNIEYNKEQIKNSKNESVSDVIKSAEINKNEDEDLLAINEVTISKERIEDIKIRVSKLCLGFLDLEINNKKTIDYSYMQTYNNVKKIKYAEKNNIVSKLGSLDQTNRKVEKLLKKYKLEKWNLAKQKGFISYDKEAWDNDTMSNIFKENIDVQDDVNYEIDNDNGIMETIDEDLEEEDRMNGRNYDISELSENFYDGEFYSEDIEEDFFE